MRVNPGRKQYAWDSSTLKHTQYQRDHATLSVAADYRDVVILSQKSVETTRKGDAVDLHASRVENMLKEGSNEGIALHD